MTIKTAIRGVLAASLVAFGPAAAQAEDVIRAITFVPAQVIYARSFQKYVDMVNERGEGIVRIDVIGGPETIPQERMGEAQKNGIADMFALPAGLYLNLVPEGEAFAGSNRTPMEIREDGGFEMINEIFHEKGNTHVLALMDGGGQFHIWLAKEPSFDDQGRLDLSDIRLRSSPLYRAFFETLGGTIVVQPAGEVYTSLERGVIDGTGWPIVGFRDYGWDKFIKYRVDPGFFQVDVLISMNLDAFNRLSDEARQIVVDTAIEYERISYEANQQEAASEAAAMEEAGMEVIELTGDQASHFLNTAYDIAWERLKGRDPTHHDALKDVFFATIE